MLPRKTILTIDIDPKVTEYLESFVALLGNYEIQRASGDIEIWAKINALEPVLIIVDPHRQKRDSGRLTEEIRRKYPLIRILIPSKPSDFKDLSERIKSLLPLERTFLGQNQEYPRLLVADDEPGINKLVTDLLGSSGIEVYGAFNGEEALQVFKENRCNLALVDLRMPRIHGTELIKLLESSTDPSPPKAILVMCAGLGENLDELERLGHQVFTKPIDLETLEETVLATCKKYRLVLHKEKFV